MKRFLLLLLIAWFGMVGTMAQDMAFVSAAAANDDDTGLSWEHAKKTIPAALALVGENGVVCVMVGNYSLSAQLNIPAGVSVKGGFISSSSGTDTTRRELPGLNSRWENTSICTIIIGNGDHRLAMVNGLLEGCVLRRGVTNDKGGGVLIDGGTVRYCVIKECDAINENTLAAEGGGAYIRNNGLLTNCVITECRGDKGPAVSGGNGSLINNTITRNWPTHCGTVADYDGNVYTTVVIGQQCWTRQNLRSTHYYDGSAIPMGTDNSLSNPYYYVNYNAITASMLSTYGYLYNWTAVMHDVPASSANPSGVTGICPLGWHVPSDLEFVEMREFVNTILADRCGGYDYQIAKSLASREGWSYSYDCNVGNQSSNNNTLFTAYPSGYYNNGFIEFSQTALFWTSSQASNPTQAVDYYMSYNSGYLNRESSISKDRANAVRCVKSLTVSEPVVHTRGVDVLSPTVANSGGRCSHGGNPATALGVCWSTSPHPTIADNHTTDGSGEGAFTSQMTGLIAGTTYYVRAYLINSDGVFYGEEYDFIPGDCGIAVISDYDGNNYNTVQIGGQCWLKENLRTTHYADGSSIPYANSGYNDENPFYYRNGGLDESVYGLYYNWPAVMHGEAGSNANPSGVQGICPDGWHVPSPAEFNQLYAYVASDTSYWCNDNSEYIAKSLVSQTGWNTYYNYACYPGTDPSANNATGFSAMPAGYRSSGESYYDVSNDAYLYTSWADGWAAYYARMRYSWRYVTTSYDSKYYGRAVRCVRNQ
ncbi:MAG: fibrobacter succinogenes major paralogous domain-containing protein [Bacteroidales bacterium]|nr:fibrobacter succinogenes major paralogous domain-containing protein [Bacteroidales bacterium]